MAAKPNHIQTAQIAAACANQWRRSLLMVDRLLGQRIGCKIILAISLWAALFCVIGVRGVYAQTEQVTLTVEPAEARLMPGEAVTLRVVARLHVTNTQAITLTALTDLAIKPTILTQPVQTPSYRGDLAWTVVVTRPAQGVNLGTIYFAAEYRLLQQDGRQEAHLVQATATVKARTPDAIDTVLQARLETTIETLLDRQSGHAYLVVQNKAEMPVTITNVHLLSTPELAQAAPMLGAGFTLAMQEARTLPITLTAADALHPGKQLVVVQVDAAWESNGQPQQGSVVLSKEVTLGVFGESELLGLFSIPSLLFVPGFVLMGVLLLLSGKFYPKATPLSLEFDVKKPEFWFLAITVSMFTFLVRQFIGARDFTLIYGFQDILNLWLEEFWVGLLLWAVGSALHWGRQRFITHRAEQQRAAAEQQRLAEEQRRAALTPSENDSVLEALQKIVRNKQTWALPQKTLTQKEKTQPIFVLPTGYPETGKVWVAPKIFVYFLEDNDEAKDQLDELLHEPNKIQQLMASLDAWLKAAKPVVDLQWDISHELVKGPKLVSEQEVTDRLTADRLIEVH